MRVVPRYLLAFARRFAFRGFLGVLGAGWDGVLRGRVLRGRGLRWGRRWRRGRGLRWRRGLAGTGGGAGGVGDSPSPI